MPARCKKGTRRCASGQCGTKKPSTGKRRCHNGSRKCVNQRCYKKKTAKRRTYHLRNRKVN